MTTELAIEGHLSNARSSITVDRRPDAKLWAPASMENSNVQFFSLSREELTTVKRTYSNCRQLQVAIANPN